MADSSRTASSSAASSSVQATLDPKIPSVALSAFKGGVSKTTCTFNFGWQLSHVGNKRTLLVDLDAQSNLTQVFLSSLAQEELVNHQAFRLSYPKVGNPNFANLGEFLIKFMRDNSTRGTIDTYKHSNYPNLYLMAGGLKLIDYETKVAFTEQSKSDLAAMIPGILYHSIQAAAKDCHAEIIFLDTSPSMGPLNMLAVMTSDYFVIPCQADFFSLQALKSAKLRICPSPESEQDTWIQRMKVLQDSELHADSKYPVPKQLPKFLGIVTSMFTTYSQKPAENFRIYINEIKKFVDTDLVPEFRKHDMVVDRESGHYELATVPNFNSAAPRAQAQGVPIMALEKDRFYKNMSTPIIKIVDDIYSNVFGINFPHCETAVKSPSPQKACKSAKAQVSKVPRANRQTGGGLGPSPRRSNTTSSSSSSSSGGM